MADNSNHSSRNLLVIKASAGSGKTYNLALQYIRHLLFTTADDGHALVPRRARADLRPLNAHRLLLAITFPNKATDEMKDRLVEELLSYGMRILGSLTGDELKLLESIMTKVKTVFKEEHDKESQVKKVRKITIE